MSNRHVLISGASGFVGLKLVKELAANGHTVSALHRGEKPDTLDPVHWIQVDDLARTPIDSKFGEGVDVFINLAAPMQAMSADENGRHPEAEALAHNICNFVLATNIPRIIVMSSIASAVAERAPRQSRLYGQAKLAADRIFQERLVKERTTITLRPPAIYGPGMKNSLSVLANLIRKGAPIPLGSATQPRSYISLRNLANLIETIVSSDDTAWKNASGRVFEPSDGDAVTTRNLVRMMGEAMGLKVRLLPVPIILLRALGIVTGRSEVISGAIDPLKTAPAGELGEAFGWYALEKMPESLSFLRSA